jgi:lipopolysaccharide transport system ATP-binding protein
LHVIDVEDLWKRFRIPHQKRSTILSQIAGIFSVFEGRRYSYEELWAIKGVTFQLEHGQSLGIIGPNGSGKSTLLKLLTRVIRPEKGRIRTWGSIVPILELGIGFHGDLTVKENAVIYGVIMGLRRSEMKRRAEAILEFAGLTKFQDAKLRSLSSGMQVRLGFSIAIQTEPDVFLVDEALAVGDAEFQQKCLEKFREFKKEEKSIVLVSHSMDLIKDFCENTLYLVNGETRFLGPSEEATEVYIQDIRTSRQSH